MNFMKKYLLILTMHLILIPISIFSQSSPLEEKMVDAFIEGIENIAVTAVKSAFTPMSDYERGDLLFITSPGYFMVNQVYQDPYVSSDDAKGYTFGTGIGYALSDRVLLYGIVSGLFLDGTFKSEFYGSSYGYIAVDTQFQYYSLFAGAGYEVLESRYLNIPVFAGLNGGYYSLQADLDPLYLTIPSPSTTTVNLDGSGLLAGVSGGIAADIHIGGVSLVPYYLYMVNFNGTELDAGIKNSLSPIGISESYSVDPYRSGMLGFSAGYRMKSGWGFSLSLKNVIPLLEDDSDDATDMTSFIFAVSYAN